MEKGIKSRRRILEVAFKLFSAYSYPDVSYSLLEEASGISRGSMVYYFRNKEGIFRAVVNTFLINIGNFQEIPEEDRSSLKKFYHSFVESVKNVRTIRKKYNIANLSEAVINIERSALQYIPEFRDKKHQSQLDEIKIWEEVIRESINAGEVRDDINVPFIAKQFHSVHLAELYMGIFTENGYDINNLIKAYEGLYEMIKKQ